jgi:photosystem II stability/assembly factor-like uncharacterized protein
MLRNLTIIKLILSLLIIVNLPALSQSWGMRAFYSGATNFVRGVTYLDANTAIAVGGSNAARVRKSTDGGFTWTTTLLASGGGEYNLYAVCFTNTTTGYAVGNLGEILCSTDTGNTWSLQSNPISTEGLCQLFGVSFSSGNGIAVGANGRITWTSNGGSSWKSPTTNPAGSNGLYGVAFYNSTNAVAVGDGGLIIKSTDGGNNWTNITNSNTDALIAVRFFNGSTGIAVGMSGTVLRTTDGGDTWSSITTGISTSAWRAISFYDATHGVIAGDGASIAKTTDGGLTWASLPATDFTSYSPPMTYIDGVAFIDKDHGIALGCNNTDMQGYIFYTSNADLPVELASFTASVFNFTAVLAWKTATEINNAEFDIERQVAATQLWTKIGSVAGAGTSNVPHNYSYTDNVGSAGTYSYRLKQIDHNGAFTYSQEVKAAVGVAPNVFALNQNYPNPFNPSTEIQFTVPSDGRAILKVYNTLGQEVAILFDGAAAAGEYHQATFDASRLASGIYFSRLEFGGKMQVKKMLLLK